MKQILFITTEGITSSVYKSQVKGFCEQLAQKGYIVHILILQNLYSNWLSCNHIERNMHCNVYYFPYLGEVIRNLSEKFLVKKAVDLSYFSENTTVICRNPEATLLGEKIKKINKKVTLIYDVRGASEEEHLYVGSPVRAEYFEHLNRRAFEGDLFYYNFISVELLRYYEKKYNVCLDDKSIISPSVVDLDKFHISDSKRVAKKNPAYLYIGGTQRYQNLDKIISTFKNEELHCVLTKKPNFNIPSNVFVYINKTQDEIVEISSHCDFGVIWRDNLDFNRVSTPTKVTEYWALGLKVFAINNAGSFTSLLVNNPQLGLVVDETELVLKSHALAELKSLTDIDVRNIRQFVSDKYNLELNAQNFDNFIQNIQNEN
jgi:hypothetical protein